MPSVEFIGEDGGCDVVIEPGFFSDSTVDTQNPDALSIQVMVWLRCEPVPKRLVPSSLGAVRYSKAPQQTQTPVLSVRTLLVGYWHMHQQGRAEACCH